MDKLVPTVVVVAVLVIAFLLMLWGWRRRTRRDSGAGAGYQRPEGGTVLAETDTFYVATTRGGESLERLALPGLRFRGRARVTVESTGVTIAITGESPVFIEAAALSGIGSARVTIDRVVEKDGLLRLSWTTSGAAAADSYLRVIDPADRAALLDAVDKLLPTGSRAGHTTESEV
ncbi:PH-like domain-containing protein [Leifsonia poae]|uniref:PH-like domain-containing protein n=1 Tax=Leifsonia poae TaxID=110933 RepID=UPI001CC15188|nr:hypothetical protein [Leifsonia poae]